MCDRAAVSRRSRQLALVLAAEFAALATTATGEAFQAAGDEFQANTYTRCDQSTPHVAALADGAFVVVWESGTTECTQDGDVSGVYAQRYDASGASVGTEFQVNQVATYEQEDVAVAQRTGGGFVVTWSSWRQDGNGYAVMARRYRPTGLPQGGEFQVNTFTPSWQYSSAVAALPDGFVVTWQSYEQDGDRAGIYAQRFDDDGATLSGEFRVNTYTTGVQQLPAIAADPSGRFVIAWMSGFADGVEQDGDGGGIFAQRYAPDGSPSGGEFRVNEVTLGDQARPAVAADDDGNFLVVWESRNVEGPAVSASDGVAARRFNASGTPLGGQFLVNTYTTGPQESAEVTVTPSGEFLVAWEAYGSIAGNDSSNRGVYAQRLSNAGTPLGEEIQVNTHVADEQDDVTLAALADNGFVVAWESSEQDGEGTGIFAQRFSNALCGDGSGDGALAATDALVALAASVGSASCAICVCDANGSGGVTATDGLLILQAAVGQSVTLDCSPC
jgi:hypothetical protein